MDYANGSGEKIGAGAACGTDGRTYDRINAGAGTDTAMGMSELRRRVVKATHDAVQQGSLIDARAGRLSALLDRITPEHEEFLSVLGELVALGIPLFSPSVFDTLTKMATEGARVNGSANRPLR